MIQSKGASLLGPTASRRQFGVWLAVVLLGLTALWGCGNAEFDQVRGYRDFLKQTEPKLRSMNRVRERLVGAEDVDRMLQLFEDDLVTVVQELHDAANGQAAPEGRLGDIHGQLKTAMDDYLKATTALVVRIKAAKKAGSDDKKVAAELEKAILEWGARDKEFGDRMTQLVSDLNGYLDKLMRS